MRMVDADALERVLKAHYKPDDKKPYGGLSGDAIAAMSAIDRAPTIYKEPVRHAKWIHDGMEFDGGIDWYHCSNCGAPEFGAYLYEGFCSNCGSRMDGGAEDEGRG